MMSSTVWKETTMTAPRGFKKIWHALVTIKPLLCICCVVGVLLIMAIVVVVALIPLYLKVNNAGNYTSTYTSIITTTATTTTTVTVPRLANRITCVNQTWTSSANLLAEWLFDGNYFDQTSTYNAVPENRMSFILNGYVNQALEFNSNNYQLLRVPSIPLSSTSFTIDMWLFITGFQNPYMIGLFEYCSQLAPYRCLYLGIRQNSARLYLHFGFYQADCEGETPLPLNTWIHAAFVFDLTTLTQHIYLNGVSEKNCTQSSVLTGTPTDITIGFLPLFSATHGDVAYFKGSMDRMTVSNRVKSACEILESAALVAHFTFDTGSFLTDSSPNALQAVTESTSLIASGRYSQAITFSGSGSYYRINGFTALGIPNQPFSISLWLRPAALLGIIVQVSDSIDGKGWCTPFLGFTSNGALQAQIYNGQSVRSVTDPTGSVSTSIWSHVVQTWSSTHGLRLYINKTLVSSRLYTVYGASSTLNYIILGNALKGVDVCSAGGVSTSPYRGDMDDFRVYSHELSADDVYTLYTN